MIRRCCLLSLFVGCFPPLLELYPTPSLPPPCVPHSSLLPSCVPHSSTFASFRHGDVMPAQFCDMCWTVSVGGDLSQKTRKRSECGREGREGGRDGVCMCVEGVIAVGIVVTLHCPHSELFTHSLPEHWSRKDGGEKEPYHVTACVSCDVFCVCYLSFCCNIFVCVWMPLYLCMLWTYMYELLSVYLCICAHLCICSVYMYTFVHICTCCEVEYQLPINPM